MSSNNRLVRWFRIHIAKLITVLDILEYADKHREAGLCVSFQVACYRYHVSYDDFKNKCTQHTIENAMKFGAKSVGMLGYGYWWERNVWHTGREEFLHYLIDYYSNKSSIYLKSDKE